MPFRIILALVTVVCCIQAEDVEAAAVDFVFRSSDGALRYSRAPKPQDPIKIPLVSRAWRKSGWKHHSLGSIGPTRASRSSRRNSFDSIIRNVGARLGVDANLIKAVIRAESNFAPHAVSPKGALGLMQLMPATARHHNVRSVFDPRSNVEGGTRHLRYLIKRYKGDLRKVLAAYNAGEVAVKKYGGVPPYRETQDYVRKVLRFRKHYIQGG